MTFGFQFVSTETLSQVVSVEAHVRTYMFGTRSRDRTALPDL